MSINKTILMFGIILLTAPLQAKGAFFFYYPIYADINYNSDTVINPSPSYVPSTTRSDASSFSFNNIGVRFLAWDHRDDFDYAFFDISFFYLHGRSKLSNGLFEAETLDWGGGIKTRHNDIFQFQVAGGYGKQRIIHTDVFFYIGDQERREKLTLFRDTLWLRFTFIFTLLDTDTHQVGVGFELLSRFGFGGGSAPKVNDVDVRNRIGVRELSATTHFAFLTYVEF